jgi:glycolate oxidase FAD binding subunit
MALTSLSAELAAACPDLRDATETDAVDEVRPSVVAAPASTEETAALLRVAADRDLAVVARGAGTKLSWARPPSRLDVVLDTRRMNRLIEHAAGDLIAGAQAGLPLAEFQAALSATRQRLAIDEMVPGTTVGGLVATSPSGPRRLATGSVRDLLIGITVVRADGVVAKGGGKVVKNVAGYDLGKLITGSFGTLAVVTEATFRLHPIPAASRWLTAPAESETQAGELVAAVLHSQVVPAALEVVWPMDGPGAVTVLVEGTAAGVDARAEQVDALLGGSAEAVDEPAHLLAYPWQHAPGATALKLTCQLSAVPDVLGTAHSVGVHVQGSAGVGVLYGYLPADTDPREVAAAVEKLRATCAPGGGAAVVLDAPLAVKDAVDLWGEVAGFDLMRRVKDQFDPGRRLAPGRFVGGL